MIKWLLLEDGRTVIGDVESDYLEEASEFSENKTGLYWTTTPLGFSIQPRQEGFGIQWYDIIPPGGKHHDELFTRGMYLDVAVVDDPVDELKEAYENILKGMKNGPGRIEVVKSLPVNLKKIN